MNKKKMIIRMRTRMIRIRTRMIETRLTMIGITITMKMNKIVYCLVKLLIKNNPEKIRPLKMRTIARQPKILMKMRTIAWQPKILMKMRTN